MIDTKDILTIDNLKAGIGAWRKKPRWDQDFHNIFYENLLRYRTSGLKQGWWNRIIEDLSNWKALRPFSKEHMRRRGLDFLPDLHNEYKKILMTCGDEEPNIETITWEVLSGLFGLAADIKETIYFSPVFASKLCHFIFPNAFLVVDNEMVSISGSYSSHWYYCQAQWINCNVKNDLVRILRQEIKGEVIEHFPWSTKIVEICFIGNNKENANQG